MPSNTVYTDVLVCGAGPVGLLTAYCLGRYGVSTMVVEQHSPMKKVQYGRAAMIMPRTLEIFDQLDLEHAFGQVGFHARGQKAFRDGLPVALNAAASDVSDSFFDYVLMCRQRWTEQIIADAYTALDRAQLHHGSRLSDFEITQQNDDHSVLSVIENLAGDLIHVRSKYIVGADGGRSHVREIAGIAFEGERSKRRWVRIDGIVETNMPEARYGVTSIQSLSHGAVLWACLDHNATRIGFALPDQQWAAEDHITQADVIQEAQEALKPFTLEFKTVDWWTVYSIGQRLAANYRAQQRVFVAGDAAHTYSSGAAQGMNAGLQDAVNLAWKLAGTIKGNFSVDILNTYHAERRAVAEQIIAQDKLVTLLTEGKIPEELRDDPEKDAHKLLFRTYMKNQGLNSGLGVIYPTNEITIVKPSVDVALNVKVGERAPDVLVQRPGVRVPLRLYSQLKHYGRFAVLTFCGDTSKTATSLQEWSVYLNSDDSVVEYKDAAIDFFHIIIHTNHAGAAEESLKIRRFGQILYDVDASAHQRYGISDDNGAVLILRPDGVVGTYCQLDDGHHASAYFARFMVAKKPEKVVNGNHLDPVTEAAKGEVVLE